MQFWVGWQWGVILYALRVSFSIGVVCGPCCFSPFIGTLSGGSGIILVAGHFLISNTLVGVAFYCVSCRICGSVEEVYSVFGDSCMSFVSVVNEASGAGFRSASVGSIDTLVAHCANNCWRLYIYIRVNLLYLIPFLHFFLLRGGCSSGSATDLVQRTIQSGRVVTMVATVVGFYG